MVFLGTRDLTLSIGGDEMTTQISNCEIEIVDAPDGFKSFADAKAGGKKQFRLKGTAVQDLATGSLHTKVRLGRGTTVAAVLKPAGGGAQPSGTQQHVTGNIVLELPNGKWLGGDADENPEARFDWEFNCPYTVEPTVLSA